MVRRLSNAGFLLALRGPCCRPLSILWGANAVEEVVQVNYGVAWPASQSRSILVMHSRHFNVELTYLSSLGVSALRRPALKLREDKSHPCPGIKELAVLDQVNL